MGADGWFTLLLSNLFIVLGAGVGLAWKFFQVARAAYRCQTDYGEPLDLVLIPGVRLRHGKPNTDFVQRLERALTLQQVHQSPLLLLGGFTGDAISEAAAGASYLRNRGVTTAELILEEGSRNTLENLRNARQLIRSNGFERLAIVSNRYHLARCWELAHGLGLEPRLYAAEPHPLGLLRQLPRLLLEAYYLHWYTTGKLWSRLTRNRHSLSRIS